jgi:hypothetical protein
MAGKNFGTMFMGYNYDESRTNIGYDLWVENGIAMNGIAMHNVAYHSKGQLIKQLIQSGYTKESIKSRRVVYSK